MSSFTFIRFKKDAGPKFVASPRFMIDDLSKAPTAEQERIVILTRLRLGSRLRQIELSLANRDDMGFRLLIGRDALGKNVIIHPARSFLLGR